MSFRSAIHRTLTSLLLLALLSASLILAEHFHYLSPWCLMIYVVIGGVTFIAYALDKSAAKNNRWRIKEAHLHLLTLIGGGAGALVARRLFRHKTRKQPFVFIMWLLIMVNLTTLVWLSSPQGSSLINNIATPLTRALA